jgi:hypothetical protein
MGVLGWIILGLIAGSLAKAILPGEYPGGLIVATIIGVVRAANRATGFTCGEEGPRSWHRPGRTAGPLELLALLVGGVVGALLMRGWQQLRQRRHRKVKVHR